MLADLTLYHCGDYLLADLGERPAAALAERFDRLIFTEDVRVSDVWMPTSEYETLPSTVTVKTP